MTKLNEKYARKIMQTIADRCLWLCLKLAAGYNLQTTGQLKAAKEVHLPARQLVRNYQRILSFCIYYFFCCPFGVVHLKQRTFGTPLHLIHSYLQLKTNGRYSIMMQRKFEINAYGNYNLPIQ